MEKLKLFEDFVNEMALTDETVSRILAHMAEAEKNGDMDEIKRCKKLITGDEEATDKELEKSLLEDYGYRQIKQLEEEIFGE